MSAKRTAAKRVCSSAWLERAGWTFNEPGWWTHPDHGGICIEHDRKWWAWPLEGKKRGPYKTAVEAARSNEKLTASPRETVD